MKIPMTVRHFTFRPDERRGKYHQAVVDVGDHSVEVTCSPTGRSVHVYIDGERVGIG